MFTVNHASAMPRLTYARAGAQILQAHLKLGIGIFYYSPNAPTGSMPARGGIPVLFPQFADSGPLPKHGLVRTALWARAEESRSEQAHGVTFELAMPGSVFNGTLAICAQEKHN